MGDEELAAPGDLEHLRRFVNTRDLELDTDTLDAWFPAPADLERAVALREAFRALLLSNATGDPPPAAARETVERIGRRATLRADGHLRLVPAADAELARLLAQQGLKVARRTITKYRALMRMPSVDVRRADQKMLNARGA